MTIEPTPPEALTPPSATDILQSTDFDELDTILDDLRTRFDETPQWEFCEGFMAAVVCCRRVIPATEYFNVLLDLEDDSETPLFVDDAQFQRFFALWMRRFNEVAAALDARIESLDDERAYQPEVMDLRSAIAALSDEQRAEMDDAPIPSFGQIWAIGFMYAVESWPDEWAAPRDKEAAKVLDAALECIVALTEDDTEPATVPAFEDDSVPSMSEQRLDDFADAMWAVYDLRELWRQIGPRVETVHVGEKPGRNDPCPCGSGKKYKKCCGA
ncbi:hypothetical protein MIZ03_1210 [Rhodoferax lithotrophicus]|uniref:Zinc chelation protein SecC n=1 Tax=Rhodoferax lithotrophicus TaxID=2798804 RepID=A0ABN6D2X0_9BURK|nr:YecA family protein [Rhodoferax sp. MIZ03]BCO26330.1 hypothetical protein MIZ03_1210 [Rhodoferax sp. MIZ03]